MEPAGRNSPAPTRIPISLPPAAAMASSLARDARCILADREGASLGIVVTLGGDSMILMRITRPIHSEL